MFKVAEVTFVVIQASRSSLLPHLVGWARSQPPVYRNTV